MLIDEKSGVKDRRNAIEKDFREKQYLQEFCDRAQVYFSYGNTSEELQGMLLLANAELGKAYAQALRKLPAMKGSAV